MKSAHRQQSVAENKSYVLQVPLTPALIPLRIAEQRRRTFLVAAVEIVRQTNLESGAPHQCGLHEVVTEDLASKRRRARQGWQATVTRERLDADDRVVPPVV